MADKSKIEWTDATWNPIVGCSIVSPGCTNCYAMKMAARIDKMTLSSHYEGLTKKINGNVVWTGKVALANEYIFTDPLRWKKPRRIFVNSMGDLFHESIPDEWIDKVFAVMALSGDIGRRHTFQILTKRADRMRAYIQRKRECAPEYVDLPSLGARVLLPYEGGLPNSIWLGVSAERQQEADERIPLLLQTPAAVRFVSLEPLLGPIDLSETPRSPDCDRPDDTLWKSALGGLDWVIVGGESGRSARPMHPDWARSLRDQCDGNGVPFFFKQFGEWAPAENFPMGTVGRVCFICADGQQSNTSADGPGLQRGGKKAAGRLLDGKEHNGFPGSAA